MSADDPISNDLDPDGYALIGACFEVYNELGNGYLGEVHQQSLELELTDRSISYVSQPRLPIAYKGRPLSKHDQADLLIRDKILVEIKAVRAPLPEHEAQPLHYLKSTGPRVGYLVNFGASPKLDWRRRRR